MAALVLVFYVLAALNPAGTMLVRSAFDQDVPPAGATAVPDSTAAPAVPESSVPALVSEAITLHTQQKYAEASAVLERIISENPDSDEILYKAYNWLVFNHQRWGNGTVEEIATRAIERLPRLEADGIEIPASLNARYDRLRARLYGSLTIKKPEETEIFLNGESRGPVPLLLEFLPVGEYELLAQKEKHHDYIEQILIDPAGNHVYEEIPLERIRGTGYWVPRILAGVVVVGAAVGLSGGSAAPAVAEEPVLDGPPGTPE